MRREFLIIIGLALVAVVISVFVLLQGSNKLSDWLFGQATVDGQLSGAAVVVPFTKIAQGSQSAIERRVNYFITSVDQLNTLWKMVDATSTPPAIDFKKDAVIAVFAGEQPTTGYAIMVSKIEDSSTRLVSITLARPDGNCMVGQAFTAPYELVTLPATSLPLAHEDTSTTISCPK